MIKTNQKITTILFDLDETLSDHRYSLEHALTQIRGGFAVLAPYTVFELMDLYQAALDEAFAEYLAKKITHEETNREKIRLFFKKAGGHIAEENIDPFLALYRKTYSMDRRATLGTTKTLRTLRNNGYKIGVVTNGEENVQKRKLQEIGIEDMIDAVIVSSAVGVPKPSMEIFAAALSALNSQKEETLMVGDSIQKDIEGALDHGIGAVLYKPLADESEIEVRGILVPVISHMEELLILLGA